MFNTKPLLFPLAVVGIAFIAAAMFLIARKWKLKDQMVLIEEHAGTPAPPQAPMRGPSRQALIVILQRPDAETHLPIILAKYSPDAIVQKEESRWVIRSFTSDKDAITKAAQAATSAGKGFRSEDSWRLRRPGPVLVEATTKEDFIHAVMKMKWDFGEEDGRGEAPFLKRK